MGERNMEKLASAAKIPTRYHLTISELDKLTDVSRKRCMLDAMIMAFQFGFIQGGKCEKKKASAKKATRRSSAKGGSSNGKKEQQIK